MQKQKGKRNLEQEETGRRIVHMAWNGDPRGEWISEEGSGAFDWKLGIESLVLISHRPEFGTRCKFSLERRSRATFLTSRHPHRLPLCKMELAIVLATCRDEGCVRKLKCVKALAQ